MQTIGPALDSEQTAFRKPGSQALCALQLALDNARWLLHYCTHSSMPYLVCAFLLFSHYLGSSRRANSFISLLWFVSLCSQRQRFTEVLGKETARLVDINTVDGYPVVLKIYKSNSCSYFCYSSAWLGLGCVLPRILWSSSLWKYLEWLFYSYIKLIRFSRLRDYPLTPWDFLFGVGPLRFSFGCLAY